jgi:DNA-binding PadR family transcriptional regulator
MRGSEAYGEPGPEEAGWGYWHGRRRHGRSQGGPGRAGAGWHTGWQPPGPPMFWPGPGWFGAPRHLRGPRVRRGDVRAAMLALLAEQPRNGYQIIQEIGERSGGLWRPSPGSVYPALQQLEDEGLVRAEAVEGGRRQYVLTGEGSRYVSEHQDEMRAPWDVVARSVGSDALELRSLFGQVVMAAIQVARVGTDAQVAQARQVLSDARRSLYRILAADDQAGGDEQ